MADNETDICIIVWQSVDHVRWLWGAQHEKNVFLDVEKLLHISTSTF